MIDGNRVDRNGDDGIEFVFGSASMTGNHVWWNGDLGIKATKWLTFDPQVTGGGNWAKHNGNPAQCIPASLCSTKGKPKGR